MRSSGNTLVLILILGALWLTAPAESFGNGPLLQSLQLRRCQLLLETTSDWSQVQIESDAGAALSFNRLLAGQDAPGLSLTRRGIHKKALDATYVKAEYDLYFDEAPKRLILRSTKGAIGHTTLTLLAGTAPFRQGHDASSASFAFPCQGIESAPVEEFSNDRFGARVLAFYYPWYGSPDGPEGARIHWPEGYTNKSRLGEYSSRATSTLEAHFKWLQQARIDSIIVSWWGPNSYADVTIRDHLLPAIVGQPIDVCLYLEDAKDLADLQEQIRYIHDTYGAHPNHLRVEGKPVLFVYSRVMHKFTPAQFDEAFRNLRTAGHDMFYIADSFDPRFLECFDGLHTYNPVGILKQTPGGLDAVYQDAWLTCRRRGKLFVGTVLPGYDDSHIGRQRPIVLSRSGTDTYRSTWRQAVAAHSDWIAICTFNEWHEGSEIEPSREHGTRFLEMTAELATRFKGKNDAQRY